MKGCRKSVSQNYFGFASLVYASFLSQSEVKPKPLSCSLLSLRSKFFIMSSFAGNKLMWKYLICRLCLARKWVESCLVHSIPCASCDMPEKLFCNSTYTTFYAEMSRQCEKNSRYMTAEFVFILKFVCSWLYLRLVCRTWHRYLKGRKFLHVTH